MRNEKLIPASAFIVAIMGTVANVERHQSLPGSRFWIGLAVGFLFISILHEVTPEVGTGLAVLVMVSALLGYGDDVYKFAATRGGGNLASKPPPRGVVRVRPIGTNPVPNILGARR